jgi:MFS family permease
MVKLDERIKIMFISMGLETFRRGLSMQYDQLYAVALGANPFDLGSLNAIGTASQSFVSVPAGLIADRYDVKKVILIGTCLSIAVSGIYAFVGEWMLLIPAIILSQVCMILVMPFADILLVNTAKSNKRATIIGLSRAFWAIPSIFAPIFASLIVAKFGGINAQGIQPIYLLQIILSVFILFFVIVKLKNPVKLVQKNNDRISLIRYFQEISGEKRLKKWLIMQTIQTFGSRIAMPFISLWIVEVKGADPYTLGAMGLLSAVVAMFLSIPVGKLADAIGPKKTFYLFQIFAFLGVILLITAPSTVYLLLVTMFLGAVPEEKRGRWLGITTLFQAFAIPAPFIGSIMWEKGLMKEALVLPILLTALVVIPIMTTIPDTVTKDHTNVQAGPKENGKESRAVYEAQ